MDTPDVDIEAIERELEESQKHFVEVTTEARRRRQAAVMAALAARRTKYRIAAVMDIKGPSVDSIIKAAEREAAASQDRADRG